MLLNQNTGQNKDSETQKQEINILNYGENDPIKNLDEVCESLLYLSEITKLPFNESKNRNYIDKKWEQIFIEDKPIEIKRIMAGK